ncbi:MAG: tetratricopeptide repeat protein [Phycisphaerae bacterium]|nr:tetratricopeptide repeat protein [Phycisphaerae bacterium]
MFPRRSNPKTLADLPRTWTPRAKRGQKPARWMGPLIGALVVAVLAMLGLIYAGIGGGPAPVAAKAPAPSAGVSELVESGRRMMQRGDWGAARAVLGEAASRHADDQGVRIALAEACLGARDFAAAYEQYEKALAIGPREGSLEFAAGQAASSAGLNERAIEHFSMAQSADPKNAAYALRLGLTLRKAGRNAEAKATLLRAANLDPDLAHAWGMLADIALAENNVNLALQHVARARGLQPEAMEWRLIEARALKRHGDPERALHLLVPLDASQRREPPVARLIAECHGMLGRHAQAADAIALASLAMPTDGVLAYDAAAAFERAGNRAKAIEHAKRAAMLGNSAAPKLLAKLGG